MTLAELKATYDQAIPATDYVNNSGRSRGHRRDGQGGPECHHYCVYSQVGNWFAYKLNPAGAIPQTTDPTRGLHVNPSLQAHRLEGARATAPLFLPSRRHHCPRR